MAIGWWVTEIPTYIWDDHHHLYWSIDVSSGRTYYCKWNGFYTGHMYKLFIGGVSDELNLVIKAYVRLGKPDLKVGEHGSGNIQAGSDSSCWNFSRLGSDHGSAWLVQENRERDWLRLRKGQVQEVVATNDCISRSGTCPNHARSSQEEGTRGKVICLGRGCLERTGHKQDRVIENC